LDIDVPIKDLGLVDQSALVDAVMGQDPEAWLEQSYRQEEYEVHKQTESIVMLFCSPTWPEITVSKEPGWTRISDVAQPLMDQIIADHYTTGGIILRAMAAKLPAGGRIAPHHDSMTSFRFGHRIHIPITTNKSVRFMIGGRPHQMQLGHAYEINNQMQHSVLNAGKEDRITFIFDYMPKDVAERQKVTVTYD